jgi:hypothetical protein
VSYSAQGRPIYQHFDTPLKLVNFNDNWYHYSHWIKELCDGAKVISRQIVNPYQSGSWAVSMNHLNAKGAVEINPYEWKNSKTMREVIRDNHWPKTTTATAYNATLVWWPDLEQSSSKRTHSRTTTLTDIELQLDQEIGRATRAESAISELPDTAELLRQTVAVQPAYETVDEAEEVATEVVEEMQTTATAATAATAERTSSRGRRIYPKRKE